MDDYEIQCLGVGQAGTKLVSVYGYGFSVDKAAGQAKMNAVKGLIFKGASSSVGGCQGIDALMPSVIVEERHKEYFRKFFEPGGPYLRFVSDSRQARADRDVIKVDRNVYKVGVAMAVDYDALRKELESAGIIKGLGSGF